MVGAGDTQGRSGDKADRRASRELIAAYHQTHRFAVNLVFSPAKRVDVGLELLQGSRTNKDRNRGEATQVQLVTLIRF